MAMNFFAECFTVDRESMNCYICSMLRPVFEKSPDRESSILRIFTLLFSLSDKGRSELFIQMYIRPGIDFFTSRSFACRGVPHNMKTRNHSDGFAVLLLRVAKLLVGKLRWIFEVLHIRNSPTTAHFIPAIQQRGFAQRIPFIEVRLANLVIFYEEYQALELELERRQRQLRQRGIIYSRMKVFVRRKICSILREIYLTDDTATAKLTYFDSVLIN
ncbi:hypothetical protein F5050DRAFT_1710802 [Lentinula boryana]|uniref:Uncharacterized protein n=1 Tax=Lentinula boryana TaxID=40481 RepID=A0ABQ8QHU0_9AGAR|nr:hypothetical protein F5050DRAFT_1710802 [Lentinula boryana]